MAVAIGDLETLMTTVNGDGTKTNAQKCQVQTLLYAAMRALFGPAQTSTVITGGANG